MKDICRIYRLSKQFYIDYPYNKYPEILLKNNRAYYCLIVKIYNKCYMCLPFRSNINHNNAYKFKTTARSHRSSSGIDYSKMVIIKDDSYFDDKNVLIDKDEFNETMKNIKLITDESTAYLETYINHINGTAPLHKREFARKNYTMSSLQYFHDILGLNDNSTKQPVTI